MEYFVVNLKKKKQKNYVVFLNSYVLIIVMSKSVSKKIRNICVKYLMSEANIEEMEILENWLKQPKNRLLFTKYTRINFAVELNMNPFDKDQSIRNFLDIIKKNRLNSRKQRIFKVTRYAAVALIGMIVSTYFFKDEVFDVSNKAILETSSQNIIEPGTDKAILTIEDGSKIKLVKGKSIQIQNASNKGNKLSYKSSPGTTKNIVYHSLKIPRGGQYFIKLSDGTNIWLNSETHLRYPVSFIEGETRVVELIYGEAYFEVSPSAKLNGSRFKVISQSQEVEVLGTEFNIKAYKNENLTYTTLVEGKVDVNSKGVKRRLKPNQQLSLNIKTDQLNISFVDVFSEISWKDGIFSFEDKSLHDIMKVISRWYDIEVVFEDENVKKEEFFGLLRKDQELEKIMFTIKEYGIIENYEFNNKILTIK